LASICFSVAMVSLPSRSAVVGRGYGRGARAAPRRSREHGSPEGGEKLRIREGRGGRPGHPPLDASRSVGLNSSDSAPSAIGGLPTIVTRCEGVTRAGSVGPKPRYPPARDFFSRFRTRLTSRGQYIGGTRVNGSGSHLRWPGNHRIGPSG